MQNNLTLKQEKRKLALVFSVTIFVIVFSAQIVFSTYKFFDNRNNEYARLSMPFKIFSRWWIDGNISERFSNNPIIKDDLFVEWNWENKFRSRPRPENIIIRNNIDWSLFFSNIQDNRIIVSFIELINKEGSQNGCVHFNDADYFFVSKNLWNMQIYTFTEARFTYSDYIKEIFEMWFILFLITFLLYYILYIFVDKTLSPVEKNLKNMEDFIYNAWHELKTPLAVIKSSLQVAKNKKDNIKNINESIDEINKMNELIESLIDLSTFDNNQKNEEISLSNLIEEILVDFKSKIDDKNLKIIKNFKNELKLNSNREYTKILFRNLISNSIKYNNNWWEIKININDKSIEISDTWIWMKQENMEKIFDRFYRENEARNEEWWWVGLSMVKKIAEIYSWKIEVDSEFWKGTKIQIIF